MRIVRTIFQDNPELEGTHHFRPNSKKVIVVLDLEDLHGVSTATVPGLAEKIEAALPGIFPSEDEKLVHLCGGKDTEHEIHSFREEIEHGTSFAHLMEHVLLYLLSRRSFHCAGYTGRRSVDIEQGIHSHYYMVVEYPTKLEAIVAIDLAFELVKAWSEGRTVRLDPHALIGVLQEHIGAMLAS